MGKLKPDEFLSAVKKGALSPVYLLYGEDMRAIGLALASIEERLADDGPREFNTDYFHGKESAPGSVIGAANTLPMMAEKRLVVVRRMDEWKGADRKALDGYLSSPNPSTIMVLTASGLALRGAGTKKEDKALVDAAAKAGDAVAFPRPTARDLPRVVREMARERGKDMDPAAVEALMELAGDEMLGLEHELDKVVLYAGDKPRIERDDVLEAVADVKEANVFEFTDAIGARRTEAALRSFRMMRDEGQEPLMILGMLLRHFRLIWRIRQCVDEGQTPGLIAKRVRLNEWVLRNSYLPQINKFHDADMGRVTKILARLDATIKSAGADQDVLFERTVMKLCLGRLG